MKMARTFFSPLGRYSKKSQDRKASASVESSKGGKKKKYGIVHPSAAETRGSDATASNCVALRATGVRTNPQNDAATDTPIQGRKNTNLCPGIGEAI